MKKYKSWVLFFDEEGKYHCGSEWAHAFNLMPKNAKKRIMDPQYHKPKNAVGFVVLTEGQFMMMSYKEIEEQYKKWGFKLNERN